MQTEWRPESLVIAQNWSGTPGQRLPHGSFATAWVEPFVINVITGPKSLAQFEPYFRRPRLSVGRRRRRKSSTTGCRKGIRRRPVITIQLIRLSDVRSKTRCVVVGAQPQPSECQRNSFFVNSNTSLGVNLKNAKSRLMAICHCGPDAIVVLSKS